MQDTRTLEKINGPNLSAFILRRPKLVLKFRETIGKAPSSDEKRAFLYKLAVFFAPAGYGKTTFLADFIQQAAIPCCWYFLDYADTDELTFLKFLLLSIRLCFPKFSAGFDLLLDNADTTDFYNSTKVVDSTLIVDSLVAAINAEIQEDFVICLCNYHEVNANKRINKLVNHLLRKLPVNCLLIIESRAVPLLDFSSLLTHNEIVGFDSNFLCFNAAEICDLADLQEMTPITKIEAEQLNMLFSGWITGILLGTHLGDRRILHARRDLYKPLNSPEIHIDRQSLLEYLVDRVFKHEPQVYDFLKEVVVLRQMEPELCDVLLSITDSNEHLQYLEQQGLFITRVNIMTPIIYICHPVLREIFCEELRRHSPERFLWLHQRATELYSAARRFEQAIDHALTANLTENAAFFILEIHEEFFAQGRVEILSHWIDLLPATVLECYPALLLTRAKIHMLAREFTLALPFLETASEILAQNTLALDASKILSLKASIFTVQAEILFLTGAYKEAQQLCRWIIDQVPREETTLLADIHTLLGACANVQGDYTAGVTHLHKAILLWGEKSQNRQTAKLHNTLARTYGLIGNFVLAEHHLMRATQFWNRSHDGWGKVNNLLNMGMIKQRQEEYSDAEAFFREALEIARSPLNFRRGEAYALVNLSELYQEQGFYQQSLLMAEDGLMLARQIHDKYLVHCTLSTLAMAYLLTGNLDTALFFVSEMNIDDSSSIYERSHCELTRGMILLYQRCYEEAYACFVDLKRRLHPDGSQVELLRTTLRIAECLLAQQRFPDALEHLHENAELVQNSDCKQIVLQELRLLPALKQAMRRVPELANFRSTLSLEAVRENAQEKPEAPTSLPSSLALSVETYAHLKIIALGDPILLIDEQPVVHWRRVKAMELFFLLLSQDHPMRKDVIIAELWPEKDEPTNQLLYSTIHCLRKVLGEACVVSEGGIYQLNLSARYEKNIWYDVALFQQHKARAKQALEQNNDSLARSEFLAMVDLYRGDFVQAFYSNWCILPRDKFRLAYLDACESLARIAWRNEQFEESALHWQHVLTVDNCFEDAHYGLMCYYMHQGKREMALRQYQMCAEILQSELAVEPGPTIQSLRQHLVEPFQVRPG